MRNLRVLATDQRTDNIVGEDGKTQVRGFSNVTIEGTPKIAEQIAVAQTLGSLSLSLRSIADNSSELEQAIANGDVKVPEGNDPKAEKAMMAQLAAQPVTGSSSFAVGADVSRFQRRTVPGKPAAGMGIGGPPAIGAPVSSVPYPGGQSAASLGPVVRVSRGNSVTEVAVGGKK